MSKTLAESFKLDQIQYPAFIVVFGESKHYITSYNRCEYSEHFACDVCRNVQEAQHLFEGFEGPRSDLKVYVTPQPSLVQQLICDGNAMTEYDASWDSPELQYPEVK